MDCRLSGSYVHGFSRQEYWSGLPFPFPGDLPDPGIKPGFPALQADSIPSELAENGIETPCLGIPFKRELQWKKNKEVPLYPQRLCAKQCFYHR